MTKQRGKNVTMIGMMSDDELYVDVFDTTNAETVHTFIGLICEIKDMRGSVIVLDNHRAHYSKKLKDLMDE